MSPLAKASLDIHSFSVERCMVMISEEESFPRVQDERECDIPSTGCLQETERACLLSSSVIGTEWGVTLIL